MTSRDSESWARPVDRLATTAVGSLDRVTGKRVVGPVQGFGQMWQKTFRVRLDGSNLEPPELVALWKEKFSTFWPKGSTFYAPLAGIAPGEVALLDVSPVPGSPVRLSTGIMVIYADEESFAFMTPEGHALSAWITFSAYKDGDVTVAQAQTLERPADPFDELAYMLGGNRLNDRFWEKTLDALARSVGVVEPNVETQKVCVDRSRQWRFVRNLRHSAMIGTMMGAVTAPARWVRRRTAGR